MWDGGKLDEKTWRQMDSELSVSSIASLREEEEEEIGSSLPPRIRSTERGVVILSIPQIIESSSTQQKIPSTSHVRVRWWGENKPGSLFHPLKKSQDENETQSIEESFVTSRTGRVKYPICASRRRFSQYLNDMKILVLDVIDRETRKKYGKCEVPVKVQGTTDEAFGKITLKEAECEIKSTVKGLENEVIGFLVVTLEIFWEDSSLQHKNLVKENPSPTQVEEIDETDLYLTSPVANPALHRRRSSPIYQSVPPGNNFGRSVFNISQIQQDPDESVASVNSVASFQPYRYFSPLLPSINNTAPHGKVPLDRSSSEKAPITDDPPVATRLSALLEKGKALRRSMEQAGARMEANQEQIPMVASTIGGEFLNEHDKEIKTSLLLATCHALTSKDGSSTGKFLDWKDLLAHMRNKTGELEETDDVPTAQPKPVLKFGSVCIEFQANFLLQLRRLLRSGSALIQLLHTNPAPSSQKLILATTIASVCKGKNLVFGYNFTSDIASDPRNNPKFIEFRIVFESKNQQKGSYHSSVSKNSSIILKGSITMEKIVDSLKESDEFKAEIILHEERKNRFSSARTNRTMPKEIAAKMYVIFTGSGLAKQSSSKEVTSPKHNDTKDLDDTDKENIDLQQVEYQSPHRSFDSVKPTSSVSSPPVSSPVEISQTKTVKRSPKHRSVIGNALKDRAICLMIKKALNVRVGSNFSSGPQFKKKRNLDELSIWVEYTAPFIKNANKRFKSKTGKIRRISGKNVTQDLINIQFDHTQILPIDENADFELIEDLLLIVELWSSFNKAKDEKPLSKKLLGLIKIPLSAISKRQLETSFLFPCSCINSVSTISDPFSGNSNGLLEINLMLENEVKVSEYLQVLGPVAKLQAIVRGALSRQRYKIKRKHFSSQQKLRSNEQDHTTIVQLGKCGDTMAKEDDSQSSSEVTNVNTQIKNEQYEIKFELDEPEDSVEALNNVSIHDTTVLVGQSIKFCISKCFELSGLSGFGCEILGKAYVMNDNDIEFDANNEPLSFVLWWDPESFESNTSFQSRKNIQYLDSTSRKISLELLFRLKHLRPQQSSDDDGGVDAGKAYATFSFDMKSGDQDNRDKRSVVLIENINIQWEEEVLPFLQHSQTLPLQISVEEERVTFARVVIKRTPSPRKKKVINHSQLTTTARLLPATTALCVVIKDVKNFNEFLEATSAKSKPVKSVCFEYDVCLGPELHAHERLHPDLHFDKIEHLWFRTFRSIHFDVDVIRHGTFKFINHAHMIVHPDWITYLQRNPLIIRVLTNRVGEDGPIDDDMVEIGHASIPLANVLLHVQGVNDRFPLEVLQTNGSILSVGKVGVHVYIDHEDENRKKDIYEQRNNLDSESTNTLQMLRLKDEEEHNLSLDESDISSTHEGDAESGHVIMEGSKLSPLRRPTAFRLPTSNNDNHDHLVHFEEDDHSDNENKGKSDLQQRSTGLYPTSEDIRKLLDAEISDEDSEHHMHFAEDYQTNASREKMEPFRRGDTEVTADLNDHLHSHHHVHFQNEENNGDDRKNRIHRRLIGLPSQNERNKFEELENMNSDAGYQVHFAEDAALGIEDKSPLSCGLFSSVDDMKKMIEQRSNDKCYSDAGSGVNPGPTKFSEFWESAKPLPDSSELNTSFSVECPVLQVVIHEARNLTLDFDSSNDYPDDTVVAPTTWISFLWQDGLTTLETPLIKKSFCPQFDYSCIVAMTEPSLKCLRDQTMTFNVWQEPNLNSSVRSLSFGKILVGKVCVDLTLLSSGWKSIEGWYHVVDEKHRNRGQVKISVTPITGTENVSTEFEMSFEKEMRIHNADYEEEEDEEEEEEKEEEKEKEKEIEEAKEEEKEKKKKFKAELENDKVQLIIPSVGNELNLSSEGTIVNAVGSPDSSISLSSAVESIVQVAVEIQQKFGNFSQNKVDQGSFEQIGSQNVENTTDLPDDIELAVPKLNCEQNEYQDIEEDTRHSIDEIPTKEEGPTNSLLTKGTAISLDNDAFHEFASWETISDFKNTEEAQEQVGDIIPTVSGESSGFDETITMDSLYSSKSLDSLSNVVVNNVTSDFLDQSVPIREIKRETVYEQEKEFLTDTDEVIPVNSSDSYNLESDKKEGDAMNDQYFPAVSNELISANSSRNDESESGKEEKKTIDQTHFLSTHSNEIRDVHSNDNSESESVEEECQPRSIMNCDENTIPNTFEEINMENVSVVEHNQVGEESEVTVKETTTSDQWSILDHKDAILTAGMIHQDFVEHLTDEAQIHSKEGVLNEDLIKGSDSLEKNISIDEVIQTNIEEETIISSEQANALSVASENETSALKGVLIDVAVQASFPDLVEQESEPAIGAISEKRKTCIEVQTPEQIQASCPIQSPMETPIVPPLHSSFASSIDKFDFAYQLLTELREKCPELGKRNDTSKIIERGNDPSKDATLLGVENSPLPIAISSAPKTETSKSLGTNQEGSLSNFLDVPPASSINENLITTPSKNLTGSSSIYNVPSPININETTIKGEGFSFSLSSLASSSMNQVHFNSTSLRTPFDSETERIAKIMKGTLDFWMDEEEDSEATCKEEEEKEQKEVQEEVQEEKQEEEEEEEDDYFF